MVLELTEHLYIKDEVIMSLKQCILKKKPLHETLYWLWELYYSGEDIDRIVFDIFLEFYSALNPHLYRYINLKRKKYLKTKDLKEIASIVSNLRINVPCLDSYLINYYLENPNKCFPLKIYKKKINYCLQLNEKKELIPLIMSIYHYNIKNIAYYLLSSLKKYDVEVIFDELINYYKHRDTPHNIKNILWSECKSVKLLISFIVYMNSLDERINNQSKYIAVDTNIVNSLNKHFNLKPSKVYYTLKEKRIYETHYELGPFNYSRLSVPSLKEECCYYWEFYCSHTPSWKNRFDKYSVSFKDKSIQFENDDLLEEFYENYGFEFDEQSIETQEKSIHKICIENDPFIWFNKL